MTTSPPTTTPRPGHATAAVSIPVINIDVPRNGVLMGSGTLVVGARTIPRDVLTVLVTLSTTTVSYQKIVVRGPAPRARGVADHSSLAVTPAACPRPSSRTKTCPVRTATRRVTHLVVLYRSTTRLRADSQGRITAIIRLTYAPARTIRATLLVALRDARGTATRRVPLTLKPAALRKTGNHQSRRVHR